MVFIIKLSINGDIEEVNIFTKIGENYEFENFKSKINDIDNDTEFEELYKWELEKNKVLKLFGKHNGDKKNENIHQLPISDIEYNYFGDLFICLIDNDKYSSLDIEIFENIYNALYLNFMDNEEETDDEKGEDEETIFADDTVVSEEDEEEFNIDNYGENSDSSDNNSDDETKKPIKKIKKKKVIKTKEVDNKDIIYIEKEICDLTNITRIKTLEIFLSLLENKEDYFRDLERNLFNYTINTCIEKNIVPSWNSIFTQVYINKARSLYTNLAPDSYLKNKRLLTRLEKNEFTPEKIVNMSYQELFPENWKELIDEKYRRDKVLFETKKEAMTDQFQCKRCKGRETCYYEVQTRSADEPMTIFITCLNCGNRWKN
jgi:transcription elongation factor S-II